MTDPDTILLETEESMTKAMEHLRNELRGVRTGRANTGLVDYIKVNYYGASTELKALAAISIPEPTQILIKPFDAGAVQEVKKAIEAAGVGLNPMAEGKQLRINVPAPSRERRQQLVSHCKKVGEETKVVLRNARRDGNKHADGLNKQPGRHYPEAEIDTLKEEVQALLKKYEAEVDHLVEAKSKEVMEI